MLIRYAWVGLLKMCQPFVGHGIATLTLRISGCIKQVALQGYVYHHPALPRSTRPLPVLGRSPKALIFMRVNSRSKGYPLGRRRYSGATAPGRWVTAG